jgi:hypothetical protein
MPALSRVVSTSGRECLARRRRVSGGVSDDLALAFPKLNRRTSETVHQRRCIEISALDKLDLQT